MPRPNTSAPTKRQQGVLAAIVTEYVRTGQPVGSRTTREQHGITASSATIRNEMVALTELGLISQPHTSAGRVPTDVGYRYFVEHLMDTEPLDLRETAWIKGEFRRNTEREQQIDVLREGARLLSSLMQAPAVVMSPRAPEQKLQHFVASPVSSRNVLLVYVTSDGEVENRLVELPEAVTSRQLERMSEVVNARFVGAEVGALTRVDAEVLLREMGDQAVPRAVVEAIRRGLEHEQQHDVYIDGAIYVIQDPEFSRATELQRVVEALYERTLIRRMLRPLAAESTVCIRIGEEHPMAAASCFGVVATTYTGAAGARGVVAAVGSRRMPYWRAVPAVTCVAEELSEHLGPRAER
ncbi:MAG TPA: heat-inducible transcriptional repressor HrcA [Armatimonadota bacterium]|nr:heat-inducible transcriptional repressor HrcA [Armatimonadota bacterium]